MRTTSEVEPRGFEPLTSAVQRRHHTLLERSVTCRIPAKRRISASVLFPSFQEIHSGCCTVAAQTQDRRTRQQYKSLGSSKPQILFTKRLEGEFSPSPVHNSQNFVCIIVG